MKTEIIAAAKVLGKKHDIDWVALAAIAQVESAGRVFAIINGRNEPRILTEAHHFYKRLSGAKRDKAVAQGLAHPDWKGVAYPRGDKSTWARLGKMMAIDRNAAIESTSWGLGQVMGFHWQALGFASPDAFIDRARDGVEGQLDLMVCFILKNNLKPFIDRRDWKGFARCYNGPGYAHNKYDSKIAAAYDGLKTVYSGVKVQQEDDLVLRMGARGKYVEQLQRNLVLLGFDVGVDGDYGAKTRSAVITFQLGNGLNPDGYAGNMTIAAIGAKVKELSAVKTLSQNTNEISGVTGILTGLSGAAGVFMGIPWQTIAIIAGVGVLAIIMLLIFKTRAIAAIKDMRKALK